MFQDIRALYEIHASFTEIQSLALMPITIVTDCKNTDGTAATGAASSTWPGVEIKNCGNAVKNVAWSRTMEDGSPNKAMESAASYSGSTNPGGTFKYGVDMDFMGCTVLRDPTDKNSGYYWVDASDARCSAVPSP